MREILFRGKRIDNGEWVEGYYVRLHDSKGHESHRIYTGYAETDCGDFYPDWFEVDPATVGWCTGLSDKKNGKKIFAGDIVKFRTSTGSFEPLYVRWHEETARFIVSMRDDIRSYPVDETWEYEILGNIHDNPKLMEVDNG